MKIVLKNLVGKVFTQLVLFLSVVSLVVEDSEL